MSDSSFWKISDQETFEAPGLSVLFFHNTFFPGKQGGIELIQHDVRLITNADVRIVNDANWYFPDIIAPRRVDRQKAEATIGMKCGPLVYSLQAWAEGQEIHIAVDLPEVLPEALHGKAALLLEFSPPDLIGKSFHLGQTYGLFPRQANSRVSLGTEGRPEVVPLAEGNRLTVASEDPLCWFSLERRDDGPALILLDDRSLSHTNWFQLRVLLTPGKKRAAEIVLWANSLAGWRRPPVLLHSQVGYHPTQQKRVWLELDAREYLPEEAELQRIDPSHSTQTILRAALQPWGRYWRYNYASFDFTEVDQPGLYQVRCAGQVSGVFAIGFDIYQRNVWQPTLDVFFPVQMCHMAVRDRYRIWHGACHLDDALQAPVDHEHFDAYRQGPITETDFKPGSHIPGLDRGGWHDAGDFDLAAGSQATTIYFLALCQEVFALNHDQMRIDWEGREVHLHRPDGIPDLVQQVRHGVENLLGGYRASGHSYCGIIEGSIQQYAHLGDPASQTDNRFYDPALSLLEQQGDRSGKPDDRWAFTNRDTALEFHVAATLAIASRVLGGFADDLSQECLQTAQQIWAYEQNNEPVVFHAEYIPKDWSVEAVFAAVELMITTGDEQFGKYVREHLNVIESHPAELGWVATRVLPYIHVSQFSERLRIAMQAYRQSLDEQAVGNPFHLPLSFHWHGGIAWNLLSLGAQWYFLCLTYPELFEKEWLYRIIHYVLGTHPGSNISLVSGVGARSLTSAFGFNRADFSYIPGGVVLGTNLICPDFPELKEGHSFLWQQTEYVITGAATYLFCILAADSLLNPQDQR